MTTTEDKLAMATDEIADALYHLYRIQGRPGVITASNVAIVRRQLSPAMAKLESAESELSLREEKNRK